MAKRGIVPPLKGRSGDPSVTEKILRARRTNAKPCGLERSSSPRLVFLMSAPAFPPNNMSMARRRSRITLAKVGD